MENENKGFGFGTENQQENFGNTQQFGAPQGDQSFGAPQADQQFGAPQVDQSFGAPQADQQFGAPQADQQFGAPQADQSFGAPQADQQFGAPQVDQSFGAPQADQQFGAPQVDQQFGAPQADQSFGAPQVDQNFGAPQVDQNFGAPQADQQFGADQSFGGQAYGQADQQFGGNQSFGGKADQQFGYNSNMGYGMGAAPVDANGKPLKNNFGMKMTFAVLEILTCCGCNILTMIMGIIGCVFTTKANNSYKEGRWDEFKSQAKSATISLWVGFGLFVIGTIISIVLWTAGGLGDAFMEGFYEGYNGTTSSYSSSRDDDDEDVDDEEDADDDDDVDDDEDVDYDQDYDVDADDDNDDVDVEDADDNADDDADNSNHGSDHGTADGATLAGDVYVYVDGERINVPSEFEDLKEMGYYVASGECDEIIESGDYNLVSIMNADGDEVMWGWMYNYSNSDAYPEECTLIGVDVNMYCENLEDFCTSEGLGFYSTREDFINTYGYPDDETGEEGDEFMCWYLGDGQDTVWQVMEVTFVDGELYDIDIDYGN